MISKLHYISQGATPEAHLEHIQRACISGADWVQLRLKNLDVEPLLEIAKRAKEITDHFQTRLIINDHYKVAQAIKADGVHLGKQDACPREVRAYLEPWQVVGGTANTIEDCNVLIEKEVDYIGLGPFRFTKTKDNLSPVLGTEGYKNILSSLNTPIPIIAIGGITTDDVKPLLETGIYGVAVSGVITQNFNAITTFNKHLKGPSTQAQVWKAPKPE